MKSKSKVFAYTYGTRFYNGKEIEVFTAKPKKEGAKKCLVVFKSKWEKAFDELWKYWNGK